MEVNLTELKGLRRWYQDQPKRVRQATGDVLNDAAFGVRTRAKRRIIADMTVRNGRFVSGRLRVTKANVRAPVSRQRSIVGSVAITPSPKHGAFSGWVEQEFGTIQKRKRFQTIAARGGALTKQVRHKVRLKPKNKVITPREYGMSPRHTTGQFIAAAKRKKENRMLLFKKAILKRKRNKFQIVQVLKKPKPPRRNKWMYMACRKYFQTANLQALWDKYYLATLKAPHKR